MKKLITLCSLMLCFGTVFASHYVGGYIQLERISGRTFTINYFLYRDCGGAHLGETQNLSIRDLCSNQVLATPAAELIGVAEVGQICESERPFSNCLSEGGSINSFERFQFTLTYTFPEGCNNWEISGQGSARNSGIENTNSGGFFTFTTIDVLNCDRTPLVTNFPIPYACNNTNFSYNPLVDMTNITYNTTAGLQSRGQSINYINNYTPNLPIDGFTLNNNTGDMSYAPVTTGPYVINLDLVQGNTNAPLSSTHYAFETFIISCTNETPELTAVNNVQNTTVSNNVVSYCPDNQQKCIRITVGDQNSANNLYIADDNTQDVLNNASYTTSGTNPMLIDLCFTNLQDAQNDLVRFIIRDGNCPIEGELIVTLEFDEGSVENTTILNICEGESVQLTASGSSNYQWSSTNNDPALNGQSNNQTVTVSPSQTDTYTASSETGCTRFTDVFRINVAPQPTIQITPANPETCLGSSINLTASGADSYIWSPATGLNTTSGANVTASPAANQTYSITGTENTNGCENTTTVEVKVLDITNNFIHIEDCSTLGVVTIIGTDLSPNSANVSYQWQIQTLPNTWTDVPGIGNTKDFTGVRGTCYRRVVSHPVCGNTVSNVVCVPLFPGINGTFPKFYKSASQVYPSSVKSNTLGDVLSSGFFVDLLDQEPDNFTLTSTPSSLIHAFAVKYNTCGSVDWSVHAPVDGAIPTPQMLDLSSQDFDNSTFESFLIYSLLSNSYYFIFPINSNAPVPVYFSNGQVEFVSGSGTAVVEISSAGNFVDFEVLSGYPADAETEKGSEQNIYIATKDANAGSADYLIYKKDELIPLNNTSLIQIFNFPNNTAPQYELIFGTDCNLSVAPNGEVFAIMQVDAGVQVNTLLALYALDPANNYSVNWQFDIPFVTGFGVIDYDTQNNQLIVGGNAWENVLDINSPHRITTNTLNNSLLHFNFILGINPQNGGVNWSEGIGRFTNDLFIPRAIHADNAGGYLMVGHDLETTNGLSSKSFIAKGNSSTGVLSSYTLENTKNFTDIYARLNGKILLTGSYSSSFHLANYPTTTGVNGFVTEDNVNGLPFLSVPNELSHELSTNVQHLKTDLQSDLVIYPNPTQGQVNIMSNSFSDLASAEVIIYNAIGAKLEAETKVSEGRINIDLSPFPSGVYVVSIHHQNQHLLKQLIRH